MAVNHDHTVLRVIDGPAAVLESLGWFHPDGAADTPVLFTFDGERFLGGIGFGGARYEWIALDLQTGVRTVHDLTTELKAAGLNKLALYGSVSRDDIGRFLLGGRAADDRHMRPVVLRLAVPTE